MSNRGSALTQTYFLVGGSLTGRYVALGHLQLTGANDAVHVLVVLIRRQTADRLQVHIVVVVVQVVIVQTYRSGGQSRS